MNATPAPLTPGQIDNMKRAAKRLKKSLGISHTAALEELARQRGFDNYTHLLRVCGHDKNAPMYDGDDVEPANLAISDLPVILWGPKASGKTINARTVAEVMGCTSIVDDWSPGDVSRLRTGVLLITNAPPEEWELRWNLDDALVIPIEEAKLMAESRGFSWINPK